ncbi:MAG: 2-C-methyl-D-erythritol 4-phosphate cytidylyltransferase, partial [Anaplasma sp.]
MVVVAAGESRRLGGAGVPKQYMKINGQEVLWHAITCALAPYVQKVLVVINSSHNTLYKNAMLSVPPIVASRLLPPVYGGSRRQDSVLMGLEGLSGIHPNFVIIHDACRPLAKHIPPDKIEQALSQHAGIVPALSPVDTLQTVADGVVAGVINRESIRMIQTPQVY